MPAIPIEGTIAKQLIDWDLFIVDVDVRVAWPLFSERCLRRDYGGVNERIDLADLPPVALSKAPLTALVDASNAGVRQHSKKVAMRSNTSRKIFLSDQTPTESTLRAKCIDNDKHVTIMVTIVTNIFKTRDSLFLTLSTLCVIWF